MSLGYGEVGFGEAGFGGDEDAPEQAPWDGEPHPIPGRIEAEHFDVGGEGVAYHETDPPAAWAVDYRPDTGVDIKAAPGTTDGMSVGRFKAEEWLAYTVAIESGVYEVAARVGTAKVGRELAVSLDGVDVATLPVPETGWGAHEVVTSDPLRIESAADGHILRLSPTADGVDVDWIEFTETEPMTKTASISVRVAEQGVIDVTVVDEADGEAVEGADVTLSGAAEAAGTTDADGVVTFDGLTIADYTLTISPTGYLETVVDVAADEFEPDDSDESA